MNALALVRRRRSARTFDGHPLRAGGREKRLDDAAQIDDPCGLPIAWRSLSAKELGLSTPEDAAVIASYVMD